MTLLLAAVVAVVFGSGVLLILSRSLVRIVVGTSLLSNAANLFIIAAGLGRGAAPIHPVKTPDDISDPLVQALTLTSIVISFGITAFLLSLLYRLSQAHETLDLDRLVRAEREDEDDPTRQVPA